MSNNKDPFKKFMVDENQPLDKKIVADIIEPFVDSIGKNKVIEYTTKFEESQTWLKTVVYLCCRKVMLDREIITNEEVGPNEISEDTGMSKDSAKGISRDKKIKKLVAKKGGKYFIPNHKLKRIKEILQKNEKT